MLLIMIVLYLTGNDKMVIFFLELTVRLNFMKFKGQFKLHFAFLLLNHLATDCSYKLMQSDGIDNKT